MKLQAVTLLLLSLVMVWVWGCDHDTSNGPGEPGTQLTDKTCLGCHESQEMLQAALGGKVSGSLAEVPHKADG
ncbi:hypothetical protein KDK88_07625 [bacterium]|nr:hypothetical protein [bacterium]HPF35783.1 hypothetical protein [Candidatus Krumholzibacteria bacterium]HRX51536.1 hypothetical protein [Candidatus Krumholzibacteria bacterium]